MPRSSALLVILTAPLLAGTTEARTVHVPANYPTIKAANQHAVAGDTILVSPGTYFESEIFVRQGVTITSSDGPEVTIVDGSESGAGVSMLNLGGCGPSTEVSGLTLQNGWFGMRGNFNAPVIRQNVFRNLDAIILENTSALIQDNLFVHCNNGIDVGFGSGSPTILRNTMFDVGAGITLSPDLSGAVVRNNLIVNSLVGVACIRGHECFGAFQYECNDVFGSSFAQYFGWTTNPTGHDGNIAVDPIFCDPGIDDLSLHHDSPCLPGQHPEGYACGLIGLFGLGCGPTASRPVTWGAMKSVFR